MSPDKMRMAIAKECRWREAFPSNDKPHPETRKGGILLPYYWVNEITHKRTMEVPDYPHDLNACHEMEKTLTAPESERYAEFILDILEIPTPFIGTARSAFLTGHASAAQRAKAFCLTKGIYHD